ncbi:MAG TPA: class II aldolase/adducin family protein, partial [Candidatus Synoicihabitans sp.]|nr:class II aldolase/adducin family protein [Candidatus Synoicihabitans sp.]
MTDSDHHLRELVIHSCRWLQVLGLNQGTSGNISVRCDPAAPERGFWLTPSSLDYDRMAAEDIVHVDLEGRCTGRARPSSELPFHLAIMRERPDAHAIIHTHSVHATAVSCLRHDIPALHYLIALFGGSTIR